MGKHVSAARRSTRTAAATLAEGTPVATTPPQETSADIATPPRSLQLALAAARTAADNQGRDIQVLDLREQTPLFDYFVIATGTSRRLTKGVQ